MLQKDKDIAKCELEVKPSRCLATSRFPILFRIAQGGPTSGDSTFWEPEITGWWIGRIRNVELPSALTHTPIYLWDNL